MTTLVRVLLSALLLVASLATAGLGQIRPVPLGTSPGVEAFTLDRQSVTLLPNSRFATVWTRQTADFNLDVYLQLVRTDGTLVFESPGRTVAASPALESNPVVVAHAREGVLVGFQRRALPFSLRAPTQLFLQWMDDQGRPRWGAGTFAASSSTGDEIQRSPSLLASPGGGAFVCFRRQTFGPGDPSNIYCQRFSPEGRRLWGKKGVRVVASDRLAELPRIVTDGAGGLLVVWRDGGSAHARRRSGSCRGQRLGPDGRLLWGAEGRVLYKTRQPGSSFPPGLEVMSGGGGGAVLAFDDLSGGSTLENDVIAVRVDGAGERLWSLKVASGPAHQILDSLVAGPDGGFFVGVFRSCCGAQGEVVAFHRFTADGQPLWPADGVPIVDPAVAGEDPDWFTFGASSGDTLRFSWEHRLPNADADHYRADIRFGALDLAGNRLTGDAGIPLTDSAADSHTAGFAFDPESGTSFIIWDRIIDRDEVDALGAIYAPPP